MGSTAPNVSCPYCGKPAPLVSGREVYPHRKDLWHKKFYQCGPCGAYVGCHSGTTQPFGRLANARLRRLKMDAHHAFDEIWKSGKMSRGKAYTLLSEKLGIPEDQCHIGMFDEDQCLRVVQVCREAGL